MINELYFEIGEVESCIVITIELVGEVEYNLIALALLCRIDKLVYQPLANMLYLSVTCDQTIKFELDLIRSIQIRYAFMLVVNEHALYKKRKRIKVLAMWIHNVNNFEL